MKKQILEKAISDLHALKPKIDETLSKTHHGKKHSDELFGHTDSLDEIRDRAIADVLAAGGTETDIKEIRAAAAYAGSSIKSQPSRDLPPPKR